jgi:hypothetical protein
MIQEVNIIFIWRCFSILFYVIFFNFKMLDIFLEMMYHSFFYQDKLSKCFGRDFSHFLFHFKGVKTLWCIFGIVVQHAFRKTLPAFPGWCWVTTTCFCEYPLWKNIYWSILLFIFYILIYIHTFIHSYLPFTEPQNINLLKKTIVCNNDIFKEKFYFK